MKKLLIYVYGNVLITLVFWVMTSLLVFGFLFLILKASYLNIAQISALIGLGVVGILSIRYEPLAKNIKRVSLRLSKIERLIEENPPAGFRELRKIYGMQGFWSDIFYDYNLYKSQQDTLLLLVKKAVALAPKLSDKDLCLFYKAVHSRLCDLKDGKEYEILFLKFASAHLPLLTLIDERRKAIYDKVSYQLSLLDFFTSYLYQFESFEMRPGSLKNRVMHMLKQSSVSEIGMLFSYFEKNARYTENENQMIRDYLVEMYPYKDAEISKLA